MTKENCNDTIAFGLAVDTDDDLRYCTYTLLDLFLFPHYQFLALRCKGRFRRAHTLCGARWRVYSNFLFSPRTVAIILRISIPSLTAHCITDLDENSIMIHVSHFWSPEALLQTQSGQLSKLNYLGLPPEFVLREGDVKHSEMDLDARKSE